MPAARSWAAASSECNVPVHGVGSREMLVTVLSSEKWAKVSRRRALGDASGLTKSGDIVTRVPELDSASKDCVIREEAEAGDKVTRRTRNGEPLALVFPLDAS